VRLEWRATRKYLSMRISRRGIIFEETWSLSKLLWSFRIENFYLEVWWNVINYFKNQIMTVFSLNQVRQIVIT
jgi:hypothetical protein